MIKLIAADMDGTLLDSQKRLPPELPALLAELKAAGIRFAAASGRQYYTLEAQLAPCGGEILYLAENGTMVFSGGTPIFLDPIAEEHVYCQYRAFTQNTTSVFISHRLASTRFCDRIFFLEDGRIAEIGSHEELIAAGGAYAKAFAVQSRYYRDHPEETGEEAFA